MLKFKSNWEFCIFTHFGRFTEILIQMLISDSSYQTFWDEAHLFFPSYVIVLIIFLTFWRFY